MIGEFPEVLMREWLFAAIPMVVTLYFFMNQDQFWMIVSWLQHFAR